MSSQLTTNSEFALKVSDLSKCYTLFDKPHQRLMSFFYKGKQKGQRDFWAVNDISFTLKVGETLGVVGRNGAGKSTLLQLICGTLHPTKGSVTSNGKIAALLELGAGFNPEFSGRENIYLNAAIYGLSQHQIEQRIDKIIEFAAIGDFIDQPVQHYSSGMFVRLAFAVIAHVDADVLIVDEALAVGDALFSQKCMRFLEDFKKKGSILFVSHDSGSVTRLCDRAIWLDGGEMKMIGGAKEVTESYLEHIYAQKQNIGKVVATQEACTPSYDSVSITAWHDMRRDLLGGSDKINEIKLFEFETEGNSFGTGLAEITNVCIRDTSGRPLSYAVGGEPVVFEVGFHTSENFEQVIVGFLVKNRQGQTLFGENNFLVHENNPVSVKPNVEYVARFGITLPYLNADEYVTSVGIASGTQSEHVQHCWRHDALLFSVNSSHIVHGLIGAHLSHCDIIEVGKEP